MSVKGDKVQYRATHAHTVFCIEGPKWGKQELRGIDSCAYIFIVWILVLLYLLLDDNKIKLFLWHKIHSRDKIFLPPTAKIGTSSSHSAGRLATTLVATINDIIFSFPPLFSFFFSVVYFSHRRSARIKKLISESWQEHPFPDPFDHFGAHWCSFWIFEVFIEGMIESNTYLAKFNLKVQ